MFDDIDTVDELPARPRRTIPEADRELLEHAARALGAIRVEDVDGEEWLVLHFADGSIRHGWNPLLHSDDTLDLIVQLGLKVSVSLKDEYAIASPARVLARDEMGTFEELASDPSAATRRAVVRAAAKFGKTVE
jgi:hypothetical protein